MTTGSKKYPSQSTEARRAYSAKWRAIPGNREKRRQKARAYYLANRAKIRAKAKADYQADPARAKAQARKWQKENRDKINASRRAKYRQDIEAARARGREYARRRMSSGNYQRYMAARAITDPGFVNRYNSRYLAKARRELRDSYIIHLLRLRGIRHPTSAQIEQRRGIIAARRLYRQLKLSQVAQALCQA